MKLIIEASYHFKGKDGNAQAEVPFLTGKYDLPEEYPFTKNAYVGPDAGYSLDWIHVDAEQRRLEFGYHEIVHLDEQGKGSWRQESKTGDFIEFRFCLK